MLETAISLLEFYPKGKKNQRITKELFMRMFIAAYLKCKKKKKEGPIKFLMNILKCF